MSDKIKVKNPIVEMDNIAVKQNIPIGFFSLEMSCDDFVHNITCQEAKVSSKEVKRGFVKDIDLNNLINAVSRLQNSNIYIDDQSNISIAQLAVRTRRMVQTNNVKVIFIDYLGEITSDIKFPNRQEYMQYISKGVRAIAKNLKIPIVCVAQLNRDSEKANRAPIKADLRESGQIEADAHTIILLHRPDLDDKFDKPGLIQAHIVKNRFGEECRVDFGFEKTTGCILELSNLKYDLEDNF